MSEIEKVEDLSRFGLVYLASPYSKYPAGIVKAFEHVSALAAQLMQRGINVYSPIAHTHPLAIYGKIDPYNVAMWLRFDEAIMAKCDAMLVAMMPTWDDSRGIKHEIVFFDEAEKPIYYLTPETMEIL